MHGQSWNRNPRIRQNYPAPRRQIQSLLLRIAFRVERVRKNNRKSETHNENPFGPAHWRSGTETETWNGDSDLDEHEHWFVLGTRAQRPPKTGTTDHKRERHNWKQNWKQPETGFQSNPCFPAQQWKQTLLSRPIRHSLGRLHQT